MVKVSQKFPICLASFCLALPPCRADHVPLYVQQSCMDVSFEKVLASLPPASKAPLHGSTSFPKVVCSSGPCLIHALPQFPQNFQWVLSRLCPLRAIARRTALLRVRYVLEWLSFPKVSHMNGQLLPASAHMSCIPLHVQQSCMEVGPAKVLPSLPPAGKSPLHGSTSFF